MKRRYEELDAEGDKYMAVFLCVALILVLCYLYDMPLWLVGGASMLYAGWRLWRAAGEMEKLEGR